MAGTLGIIMDPISSININTDSSFALLLEAQRREWKIKYMELPFLFYHGQSAQAKMYDMRVMDDENKWFHFDDAQLAPLSSCDVILVRLNPPMTLEYVYLTHLLDRAEEEGTLVVNKPSTLRDINEKFIAPLFPECSPRTLLTHDITQLQNFMDAHPSIVMKPMEAKGGREVYHVKKDDPNLHVIMDALSLKGRRSILAQEYITEVTYGDKSIILVDGEPMPSAFVKRHVAGEFKTGFDISGGSIDGLSERDRWICGEVSEKLKDKGLLLMGVDIIGGYLVEMNIMSPGGIRVIDRENRNNLIVGKVFDAIDRRLAEK